MIFKNYVCRQFTTITGTVDLHQGNKVFKKKVLQQHFSAITIWKHGKQTCYLQSLRNISDLMDYNLASFSSRYTTHFSVTTQMKSKTRKVILAIQSEETV